MRFRLHFARAPQIVAADLDAGDQILAGDTHVTIDDGLVLERKGVERSLELSGVITSGVSRPVMLPGLGQAAERLEIRRRNLRREQEAMLRAVGEERLERGRRTRAGCRSPAARTPGATRPTGPTHP